MFKNILGKSNKTSSYHNPCADDIQPARMIDNTNNGTVHSRVGEIGCQIVTVRNQ